MEIEPNIYLAIAAAIGSLFYHITGYLDAKRDNPSEKYSYNYLLQTAIAIIGVAYAYTISDIELSIPTILLAFMTGMGGDVGVSKIAKIGNKIKKK